MAKRKMEIVPVDDRLKKTLGFYNAQIEMAVKGLINLLNKEDELLKIIIDYEYKKDFIKTDFVREKTKSPRNEGDIRRITINVGYKRKKEVKG